MKSSSLMELGLNNCGLTVIPDLSELPELCVLSLSDNHIIEVKDETFAKCTKFAILDLSNNAELRTFSDNAGFTLVDQTVNYRSKKLLVERLLSMVKNICRMQQSLLFELCKCG